MPTSLTQIATNRENAKKSTGPRSEEGKRRACQNAVTHGLYSHNFLLSIENDDSYHVYHHQLIHDYSPQSGAEFILVEQLVQAYFLKRRYLQKLQDCHDIEVRHLSNETLLTYPIVMKMVNQSDRMLHRALDNLERVKAERKKEAKEEKAAAKQPEKAPEPAAPQEPQTATLQTNGLPATGFLSSPFATLNPEDPYPAAPEPEFDEIADINAKVA